MTIEADFRWDDENAHWLHASRDDDEDEEVEKQQLMWDEIPEKHRRYIQDRSLAPEGATVHEGPQEGLFIDAREVRGEPPYVEEEEEGVNIETMPSSPDELAQQVQGKEPSQQRNIAFNTIRQEFGDETADLIEEMGDQWRANGFWHESMRPVWEYAQEKAGEDAEIIPDVKYGPELREDVRQALEFLHEASQEYLREEVADEDGNVPIMRGVHGDLANDLLDGGGVVEPRAMESWSGNRDTAYTYAKRGKRRGQAAAIVNMKVPVERTLFYGPLVWDNSDQYNSEEVTLIGDSPYMVRDDQIESVWDPAGKRKTKAEQPIQWNEENALWLYSLREEGEERVEKEWQRYEGPRGGEGWQNTQTGEILYQEEKPGGEEADAQSEPTKERALELAERIDEGDRVRFWDPYGEEFLTGTVEELREDIAEVILDSSGEYYGVPISESELSYDEVPLLTDVGEDVETVEGESEEGGEAVSSEDGPVPTSLDGLEGDDRQAVVERLEALDEAGHLERVDQITTDPDEAFVDAANRSAQGSFHAASNSLWLNPDEREADVTDVRTPHVSADTIQEAMKNEDAVPEFYEELHQGLEEDVGDHPPASVPGPDSTLIHEVAHASHAEGVGNQRFLDLEGREWGENEQDIAKHVSKYAMTSPKEFVAETFTALYQGAEMPAEVMDLYEELGGPDIR